LSDSPPDTHKPRLPQSPYGVAGSSEALLHWAQDALCNFQYANPAAISQEPITADSAEPGSPTLPVGNRVHFLQRLPKARPVCARSRAIRKAGIKHLSRRPHGRAIRVRGLMTEHFHVTLVTADHPSGAR
jgi:hypothetical protein